VEFIPAEQLKQVEWLVIITFKSILSCYLCNYRVNSTPIISLSSVSHEFILQVLFQHIVIPKAVDIELRALEKPGSNSKLDIPH